VLTETGARVLASGAEVVPVWDARRRELRAGHLLVKRFRQPARNQELVLAAFAEDHWPPRIDDPLPPELGQDAKQRLHSTITNLNRGHQHRIIRFEGGGDGESVCWRFVGTAKHSAGSARPAQG
jgi:hypothetical protein